MILIEYKWHLFLSSLAIAAAVKLLSHSADFLLIFCVSFIGLFTLALIIFGLNLLFVDQKKSTKKTKPLSDYILWAGGGLIFAIIVLAVAVVESSKDITPSLTLQYMIAIPPFILPKVTSIQWLAVVITLAWWPLVTVIWHFLQSQKKHRMFLLTLFVWILLFGHWQAKEKIDADIQSVADTIEIIIEHLLGIENETK